MVNVVLIGFAVAAVWLASLWLRPFGACRRCHGSRIVMRGTKRKPRPVQCPACKGVGRRQRPGSRTVHRTVRKVRAERDRQRKNRQRVIEEDQ